LRSRDAEAWRGVLIGNLANGDIVDWAKLDGLVTELFDVAAMPGVACPMSIGLGAAEMHDTISFDQL
jgi:hypothetical protein